jgi:Protein of unknown function (DUF3108)
MKSILHTLVTCFVSLSLTSAFADNTSLPREYSATFSATYNGLPIETTRTLDVSGNDITVAMKSKSFLGYISERERLSINSEGQILPGQYRYERSILGKKRTEATDFDVGTKTVATSYKKKSARFKLEDNLLAPLSYQLELRRQLMEGQTRFQFQVVYRNAIRDYQFEVVEEHALDTPLGTLNTIVVRRIRENKDRETLLWLAKSLDYLPVKVLQRESGESYEMQITGYRSKS